MTMTWMKTQNIHLEYLDIHVIQNTKTKDIPRSKCLKINRFLTEYNFTKMEKLFFTILFKPQKDKVALLFYFIKIKKNRLLEFIQAIKMFII